MVYFKKQISVDFVFVIYVRSREVSLFMTLESNFKDKFSMDFEHQKIVHFYFKWHDLFPIYINARLISLLNDQV